MLSVTYSIQSDLLCLGISIDDWISHWFTAWFKIPVRLYIFFIEYLLFLWEIKHSRQFNSSNRYEWSPTGIYTTEEKSIFSWFSTAICYEQALDLQLNNGRFSSDKLAILPRVRMKWHVMRIIDIKSRRLSVVVLGIYWRSQHVLRLGALGLVLLLDWYLVWPDIFPISNRRTSAIPVLAMAIIITVLWGHMWWQSFQKCYGESLTRVPLVVTVSRGMLSWQFAGDVMLAILQGTLWKECFSDSLEKNGYYGDNITMDIMMIVSPGMYSWLVG